MLSVKGFLVVVDIPMYQIGLAHLEMNKSIDIRINSSDIRYYNDGVAPPQ